MTSIVLSRPGPEQHQDVDAAALVPIDCVTTLVEWPVPPGDTDEAIGLQEARSIARALLRMGRLAFRWDDPSPSAEAIVYPEPKSSRSGWMNNWLARRLAQDWLSTPRSFGVLETSDPEIARLLFAWPGWTLAMQAALVFDGSADRGSIVAALQRRVDWHHDVLPAGCHLLFGSGHDGGSAVVSAKSSQILDEFDAALQDELSKTT